MSLNRSYQFLSSTSSLCELEFDVDHNSVVFRIISAGFLMILTKYPELELMPEGHHCLDFGLAEVKLCDDELDGIEQILKEYKLYFVFINTEFVFK